jgi:hypothetical protein
MKNNNEFIQAFSEFAEMLLPDAKNAWSDYSRQLSDAEREEIEQSGRIAGMNEGLAYLEWSMQND